MKRKKWLMIVVGAMTGAVAGYVYWRFVGYDEKSPLISTVIASVGYSAVLGGLLIGILSSSRQLET